MFLHSNITTIMILQPSKFNVLSVVVQAKMVVYII